ncbi:hypothetical protein ABGV42_01275 [Paenibacillus pabuli]|uniref:hypothetical protein n=1 Tax=Paenibacillus pabuli TaxID=1472 RepID=UPI00324206F5
MDEFDGKPVPEGKRVEHCNFCGEETLVDDVDWEVIICEDKECYNLYLRGLNHYI